MRKQDQSSTIQRILNDLKNSMGLMILILMIVLVQVGLTVYLPVLIGQAVDAFLLKNASQLILQIIEKMLVVIVISTLLQWLTPLLYNRVIFKFASELREKLINKLHNISFADLDQKSQGEIVSSLTTDMDQLQNGLVLVFSQFIAGLATIALTLISMLRIDFVMLIMVLILSPLSIYIARFISGRSFNLFHKQTQTRSELSQFIQESLQQEDLIHHFNAQDEFENRFNSLNETYASYSQQATFYSSTVNPTTRLVNSLIYAVLVGVGAFRVFKSVFSVGELVTFLNYVTQYTKPINDISSVISEMQVSLACAERIYRILDLDDENEVEQDMETIEGKVEFKEVSFSYEANQEMLKQLSLSIPSGSKVAVVGPTGAGKTTLINLLMRFYEPNSGYIAIDNTPIQEFSRGSLRKQIGMVLQESWIKNTSIHANIAYSLPNAKREEVIAAAKEANADFFIQQLPNGYDTIVRDGGESLSQGQRQLLTIARALMTKPKILILDEATSSIDRHTEEIVQDAFSKAMKGRTSFIIAHRLATIRDADIILVMDHGDIIEHGNHESLMAKEGLYYQMVISQIEE